MLALDPIPCHDACLLPRWRAVRSFVGAPTPIPSNSPFLACGRCSVTIISRRCYSVLGISRDIQVSDNIAPRSNCGRV